MNALLVVHTPSGDEVCTFNFAPSFFMKNKKQQILGPKLPKNYVPPPGQAEIFQLCTCKLSLGGGCTIYGDANSVSVCEGCW